MQFIDLGAQYRLLESRIQERLRTVLEHGAFIMGPEVGEFEKRLATFSGTEHVVTCANGTDALWLALKALEIGRGDAVFTTPFTFFATAEAIELAGARPVFVDIDPTTYNLNPQRLAQSVERVAREGRYRPRAVIAVDLFGLPADYAALEQTCSELQLELIEDAAQGLGGRSHGRSAGAFGRIATTSFFPAKPLGCFGDGGALLTRDARLAAKLRSLRVHGQGADKYDNVAIGMNSRLDTLQAAILLEKLEVFPQELVARDRIARRYTEHLPNQLVAPQLPPGFFSSWAQYSVLAPDGAIRSQLMAWLRDGGIPSAIYYARPLHEQPALAHLEYRRGDFPVSEATSERIFSLPMHAYLTEEEQDQVLRRLYGFFAKDPT